MKKSTWIIITVIGVAALLAGLGVLIWWLVDGRHTTRTIDLDGEGLGNVTSHAAFTRIKGEGDMFWWFYPTLAADSTNSPIVLWLDGVTGLPPSLLAHFAMFGPYDFDLKSRTESWVDEYNLIFVDAPLGTGFSTVANEDSITGDLDTNTEHLLKTLESFYDRHKDYENTPLYIFGQGHGAQMALSLALRMETETEIFTHNLKGVVIGNGVISPPLALAKLSHYLYEMGYVDLDGRAVVEEFTKESSDLVDNGNLAEAFDHFLTLEDFINEKTGAIAVNLRRIVDKLEEPNYSSSTKDYFGKRKYLRSVLQSNVDFNKFMVESVAPALGIKTESYDSQREAAIRAVRDTYMTPAVALVEAILQNTDLSLSIYNGNLDAISPTPGQLEWINNLQWPGQDEFLNAERTTLVVNNQIEGYFRVTDRLKFYWMNVAGEAVPMDNPVGMRRVLELITG